MTHEQIIKWASENDMDIAQTQQGLDLEDMFDVTLINGEIESPLEVAKSLFSSPTRKHLQAPGSVAYGFDDAHVVIVVVDDGEVEWLHMMLYADEPTYEQGWATQAPAGAAEA